MHELAGCRVQVMKYRTPTKDDASTKQFDYEADFYCFVTYSTANESCHEAIIIKDDGTVPTIAIENLIFKYKTKKRDEDMSKVDVSIRSESEHDISQVITSCKDCPFEQIHKSSVLLGTYYSCSVQPKISKVPAKVACNTLSKTCPLNKGTYTLVKKVRIKQDD